MNLIISKYEENKVSVGQVNFLFILIIRGLINFTSKIYNRRRKNETIRANSPVVKFLYY